MAKRKRSRREAFAPVTVELVWVADDDGTILRWADITNYDACSEPPHDPRNHILRLEDNAWPRGKRLHNMANWAWWREIIRGLPVGEIVELDFSGNADEEAKVAGGCEVAQADVDAFAATVRRLAERGIITLPKAANATTEAQSGEVE